MAIKFEKIEPGMTLLDIHREKMRPHSLSVVLPTDDTAVRRRPVPSRTHCPPSRRGHAWQELPVVSPSQGGPTIRELYELRQCTRCKMLGRVDSQGCIRVVEGLREARKRS